MTDLIVQSSTPLEGQIESLNQWLHQTPITSRPLSPNARRYIGVPEDSALQARIEAAGMDAAFVPQNRRWNDLRLLAMDMDSTLITIECIDELADMAGVKPHVAAITAAAMRGELDFQESLRQRVGFLRDLPVAVLDEVYDSRLQLSPGAQSLLHDARSAGMTTLLVSGGFTYFTQRLQQRLGLNETRSNDLEIKDGRLTGKIVGPIVDGLAKAKAVRDVATRIGADREAILVIGDGANDLPMMQLAGVSIAYRAKPAVQKAATHALNRAGLDGVRHLFT
jgi:phosphoserine phosphatase